ncbi:nuclear transport factor 2 family protein [uncultured Leifsonia sp.]|uniref:nuclear transport factor 2 family protein n=1 Tax=uncultured Leifsonia sp. TaxID=340359 RepID=UPI0028D6283E|nr:nuclear transport factor 2 family protein [uncultured Leifsonia sp.]
MTSNSEKNKATIADTFEAWKEGRGSIVDLLAPDLRWEIVGESAAAGTYTRDGFVDGVLASIGRRFSKHGFVKPTDIRLILADDDWVVTLYEARGITNADTVYDNTYAWFMRMREGQIVEAVAFYDSIAFDRMWAVPASA